MSREQGEWKGGTLSRAVVADDNIFNGKKSFFSVNYGMFECIRLLLVRIRQ